MTLDLNLFCTFNISHTLTDITIKSDISYKWVASLYKLKPKCNIWPYDPYMTSDLMSPIAIYTSFSLIAPSMLKDYTWGSVPSSLIKIQQIHRATKAKCYIWPYDLYMTYDLTYICAINVILCRVINTPFTLQFYQNYWKTFMNEE